MTRRHDVRPRANIWVARMFWRLIDIVAMWGWWAGSFAMLASAIGQGIEGDRESCALRVFISSAWVVIALRDRELRHVKQQRDAYADQRDRAFDRLRSLDPRSKR